MTAAPIDARATELIAIGEKLYHGRLSLLSLWQEIAENFYPQRADFTYQRVLGEEFAWFLMDSFPVLCCRELSTTLSTMLRPRGAQWFNLTCGRDEIDEKPENAKWLERQSKAIYRAMYDPRAKFIRATKEGDADFVTFGNAVISIEEAPAKNHLLYRSWHLRDCAWVENNVGEVDTMHRRIKMQARNAISTFGANNLDRRLVEASNKEPNREFEFRHILMPTEDYDAPRKRTKRLPFTSIYIDVGHERIVKEGGLRNFQYAVPRWQTVSGFQYSFSPATAIGLPDARCAQDIGRTMTESSEKSVNPPLIATQQAMRSDVNVQAGGITWVDAEYDEKMGEALRPLQIVGNLEGGLAVRQDIREVLTRHFFLDKLTLPEAGKDMTAYEVARRLEDFVRNALPLFEPMEVEYNVALCEKTLAILEWTAAIDRAGMPAELKQYPLSFKFQSPIQDAAGRAKVAQFQEGAQLIGIAKQLDQSVMPPVDLDASLLDALEGTGAPASWFKDEKQQISDKMAAAHAANVANLAKSLQMGAGVGGQVADATQKMRQAGLLPGGGGAIPS